MTTPTGFEALLRERHVPYRKVPHGEAFTAQQIAHASHVSGSKVAKVVALRNAQGEWLLAVVPAPLRVDVEAIAFWSGLRGWRIASKAEVLHRFPGGQPGALPALDARKGIPVFVDDTFDATGDIYLEDESHRCLIGLRTRDYVRVAHPTIRHFSRASSAGHCGV